MHYASSLRCEPGKRFKTNCFQRLAWTCLVAFHLSLLAGCSPEDAQAAKAAAAALKARVDNAINMYAELMAQARVEKPMPEEEIISGVVAQAMKDAKDPGWKPDLKNLRSSLADTDPRADIKKNLKAQTADVARELGRLESTAADYEAAWPLGSEQFVCLKENIFNLTKNLRSVATSFNADGGARYTEFSIGSREARDRYVTALRAADGAAAAASLQSIRQVFRSEAKANEDVQAAFIQAAQSSADLYNAIESIETVSFSDVLKIVQRYAPGLSRIDDSLDGAEIAKKAGVVLGKIKNDEWLTRFSEQSLPRAGIKCKTPA
ncbi:hypothetical protein [Polaromonas sp. YR568]|uniref:hypothetical protein n=1 Tax=Polaromonas sp. YR568 TaxID=1855301 RepID=UPI00398BDC00